MSVCVHLLPVLLEHTAECSSLLSLRKSCQGCSTWRTAKAAFRARVGLGVLADISCGCVACLSLCHRSCLCPCVKRPNRNSRVGKPFPTHVHKHSLFSMSSIWTSRPSSDVTFVLWFSLLSAYPQHMFLWVREAVLHSCFLHRDCLGFLYLTSWSSYTASLCLSSLTCKVPWVCVTIMWVSVCKGLKGSAWHIGLNNC